MDDMGALISSFLSNPENIDKLKTVLSAFSGSSSGSESAGDVGQAAQEANPQATGTGDIEVAAPAAAAPPQITTDMLKTAFAKLPVAEDDKRAMLLKALRPYMSQKRAGYVDTAMGILSLSKLLGKGK